MSFNPESRLVASSGYDGAVHLWEVDSDYGLSQTLRGPADKSAVLSVSFSPDGHLLASSENKTVRLWTVASRQGLGAPLTGHKEGVTCVSFSPDGRVLASGSADSTVRLWTVASGQLLGRPLTGNEHWVNSISFSPDGCLLASGGGDHTVRLWKVASRQALGKPLRGHENAVTSVSFSPDGRLLASGDEDGMVRLWTVENRKSPGEPLTGHEDIVMSVSFSPDGHLLASGSQDKTVRLWELDSRRCLRVLSWMSRVSAMAFSDSPLIYLLSQLPSETEKAAVRQGKVLFVIQQSEGHYALGFYNSLSNQYEQIALSGELGALLTGLPLSSPISSKPIRQALLRVGLSHGTRYAWRLAIGDKFGRVSVGSVSWTPPSTVGEHIEAKDSGISLPRFQLLTSSRHPQATLWADGAQFQGCQMSRSSQQLLKQFGAEVSEAVVVDSASLIEKPRLSQEEKHPIYSFSSSSASSSSSSSSSGVSSSVSSSESFVTSRIGFFNSLTQPPEAPPPSSRQPKQKTPEQGQKYVTTGQLSLPLASEASVSPSPGSVLPSSLKPLSGAGAQTLLGSSPLGRGQTSPSHEEGRSASSVSRPLTPSPQPLG